FAAPIEHADPSHPLGLLRVHHHWPRRSAPKPRDELPPPHSITSSARSKIDCGTVRPSPVAVLRLILSSTFVDCCTGKSAGFSPLIMRPAYIPARRKASETSPP